MDRQDSSMEHGKVKRLVEMQFQTPFIEKVTPASEKLIVMGSLVMQQIN